MRDDFGFGVIAATIANVNRGKRGKTFEWVDFMPHWKKEISQRTRKTPEEMRRYWETIIAPRANAAHAAREAQRRG